MKLIILGAAAGGGFPQWNCNCRNCAGVRSGSLRARPRTQSSICVAADGSPDWALLNASPDILQQNKATPELQPARSLRDTGIGGILL
ncbi:MAG: pyrroloquinoline quinone biosynthesis protein B, partial [Zoogloea sp.]|nr:pyrroloquinoline quinone biosynthesis protein B [Zoogloea sp.]